MIIRASSSIDSVNQRKSIQILLLTDNFSATYYLAFEYYLNHIGSDYGIVIRRFCAKDIEKIAVDLSDLSRLIDVLSDKTPDLVIFNRYGLPYGQILLEQCLARSIKTVYFIDDYLLHIPNKLGKIIKNTHGKKEVIEARDYLIKNVDLVWVSTPYLKQKLSQRYPKQQFTIGGYPLYLEDYIDKNENLAVRYFNRGKKTSSKVVFGYMGSKGHQEDLAVITPSIIKILENFPKTNFETFGTILMPEELNRFGNRVKSHKVITDYQKFLEYLYRLNWNFGLAPLINSDFNHCKTSVKFLEYTACNIPTLASNSLVYQQFSHNQEIILVDENQWYDKMQDMICHSTLTLDLLKNAKKKCKRNFSLNAQISQFDLIFDSLQLTQNHL